MMNSEEKLTQYLLQFCYTCQDAFRCETEEKCMECCEASGFMAEEVQEEITTEELLRLYAY